MLNYEKLNLPVVTVQTQKYNKQIYRTWQTKKVTEDKELIILVGVFENEVKHQQLGVIRPGTISLEYYWKKMWFNVFEFHEPDGGLRNFYCNVNKPPILENDCLIYVDLEIDVLVQPDLSYQTLDWDEFEENSKKHDYSVETVLAAHEAHAQILDLIEQKKFPFDNSFSKLFFSNLEIENKI